MKLLRDKSSNHFCGPAALALLTGVHVDDAARALRIVSGKRAIKGVNNRFMTAALERLGHKAAFIPPVPYKRNPTLTQALKTGPLKDRQPDQRYLVIVTGHYVTIEGRKLFDNKHPEGVFLGQCPYRRKRVRAVWRVIQVGPPAPLPLPPMTFPGFVNALTAHRLETDGEYIDAPAGYTFADGLHALAISGTYEEALERAKAELPLVKCPADCDHCYDS